MKSVIILNSRYGEKNFLKRTKGKTYQLHVNTDVVRVGYIGNDKFIDPSGGPMILENHKLEEANAIVKNINGNLITFE